MKSNVLFLCTGNSARSQMAEAFVRKHAGERFNAYSAGTHPQPISPYTLKVMAEVGMDVSQQRSKNVMEYLGQLHVTYLIVVCKSAEQTCPTAWPGPVTRLSWPFDDPAACAGTEEEKLNAYRRVRDEIEAKILDWLRGLPSV